MSIQDYNEEYFYLKSIGENYPNLQYEGGQDSFETSDEFRLKKGIRRLCFSHPIPDDPEMADFHYLKDYSPVISERMKNLLENMNLRNIQFLPTEIRNKEGNVVEGNYYIIHVYNMVKCLDREKSNWEPCSFKEDIATLVHSLVINNEELHKVPLEERLVFALYEQRVHVLYHRSVVDKLLEIEPKGMTIFRLSKWDLSSQSKEEYFSKLFDFDDDDL